jgi:hypothetical protein
MSDSDDIFAAKPPPEEQVAEARILAWHIFDFIRLHMKNREASAPFDAKHHYGFLDMRADWSRFADRDVWVEAVREALANMRAGRL